MKTKLLALLLALCLTISLLSGCAVDGPVPAADVPAAEPENVQPPVEEPEPDPEPEPKPELEPEPEPDPEPEYLLDLDGYPRMDGSTANLPLMAAVLSAATGLDAAEAENMVDCTRTSYSWERLANGECDILLVYEPAVPTQETLKNIGTDLEATPIGLDALVFIVNEQNPVESLGQDQLKAIYSGEIINWSEVGGEDLDIQPFQRPEESGSQSLFRKLLFPDAAPMEAPTEFRPAEMGQLIDSLALYNNEGNALGYSVFYYASYMYSQPGLRFLSVDGVAPSDETIADQTYPLLNPFYAVIRADEPEGSPARVLRDWLLTEEGKAVIAKAGYIPYEEQPLCGYPKENPMEIAEITGDVGLYDSVVASQDEPRVSLKLTNDTEVTDFKVTALAYENDGYVEKEVLYELETLPPRTPIGVVMTFYGLLSPNGISFVDEGGAVRHFAICQSGEDGSYFLEEFTP